MTSFRAPPENAVARAIVAVPVAALGTAEGLTREDKLRIARLCGLSPVFHALGPARTHEIIDDCERDICRRGALAVLAEARADLTPGLSETAIFFAIRAAFAGNGARGDASERLALTAARLNLPEPVFRALYEITRTLQPPFA
ncbi:hypothetical protein [Ovoidimarina sediminis]|uniref:hypothetical protein n=1 Tax=Ovoidimarina sediminis TaxID=3079856 RepID=UPI0029314C6E|nr:hypothetical protein [Rhodophyticola sp. MJ-SS7]